MEELIVDTKEPDTIVSLILEFENFSTVSQAKHSAT